MSNTNQLEKLDEALKLLGDLLYKRSKNHHSIIVCGGTALVSMGFVSRVTQDVDVIARIIDDQIVSANPLPPELIKISKEISKEFLLREDWLNSGPASIFNEALPNKGLPAGFRERLQRRDYGPGLSIFWVGRYDQIHFKFYAAADRDRGSRHFQDLMSLSPTDDESESAARWAMMHDPSEAFRQTVFSMLTDMGKNHVLARIQK